MVLTQDVPNLGRIVPILGMVRSRRRYAGLDPASGWGISSDGLERTRGIYGLEAL
jgi:hypothetical protein